jgi:hypothetical protein
MEDGGTVGWTEVPGRTFSDLADEYDAFLALLGDLDLDPVVVDLDDACPPGVSLTKVIVPELTQAFIPSHPYLGHPRFSEFGSQLNADPVPFS